METRLFDGISERLVRMGKWRQRMANDDGEMVEIVTWLMGKCRKC